MSTTVTTYDTALAELQTALERARKSKKSTKDILSEIARVQAEAEKATAEAVVTDKPKRGRPLQFSPEFYALRDSFKREGRGRPNRDQLVADLARLGVEIVVDPANLTHRELELMFKAAYSEALENAKVA